MCGWEAEKHRWRGGPEVVTMGSRGRSGLCLILVGSRDRDWTKDSSRAQETSKPYFPLLVIALSHSGVSPPSQVFPTRVPVVSQLTQSLWPAGGEGQGLTLDCPELPGWREKCCHPFSDFNFSPNLSTSPAMLEKEVRLRGLGL